MLYKIKIVCTSKYDLSFNRCKINRFIYDTITNTLNPCENNFINNIIVLYKSSNKYKIINFIDKSLEIICNTRLTEEQFIQYIKKMHNCGFQSWNNVIVEFIDITNNEIIYKYTFNLLEPLEIKQRNNKFKNKSSYHIDRLF